MKIKPVTYRWHCGGYPGRSLFGAQCVPIVSDSLHPIAEAKAAKGLVQVSGLVDNGKSGYDASGNFTFVLTDDQGNKMPVVYKRVKPANFDHAIGVVAVGRYNQRCLRG